ncbi:MAG: type II secretion system protein GspC [Gammaproteobacteria bacterium]|nr:type II secretion system protein GspC [Gammaproteobacteria bacterium]NNM13277.1 type II secretion system protein GspC [Gammaproteobacteria bacterium]
MSYIPILLSVALVCFIAWQLATLFWAIKAPAFVAPIPAAQASASDNSSNSRPSYNLDLIKRANLFGIYNAEPLEVEAVDTSNLEETRLNLKLNAAILSDNEKLSRAVIEVNGKDSVFSIGEEIQSQVSLHSVLAYHVVIDNRGKKEILRLPRQEDSAPGSVTPRSSSRSNASDRIARQIRSSALSNPGSITDIMRLKKGQTASGQKGFRIYPGKDRNKFRELGLKAGDFVTSINGMPVAEQNPFQVIQTLSKTSYINLSLERNGQAMNLSFDLGNTR